MTSHHLTTVRYMLEINHNLNQTLIAKVIKSVYAKTYFIVCSFDRCKQSNHLLRMKQIAPAK